MLLTTPHTFLPQNLVIFVKKKQTNKQTNKILIKNEPKENFNYNNEKQ